MDSWQLNKIAGAVLGTCLVGMGIGIVAQGIYEPGAPKKPGYALPEPKETAGSGGEKKPEVIPIAIRMEHADPKKGEGDAKVCSACHNFAEGAGAKVGPDLWNVVDRPKGKAEGFDYSAGMKAKGGDWTYGDLDEFLTKPAAYVQGTKMGYPGQEDPEKRADIIAYLRTLSKDPKPLPKVTDADKKVAAADAKGGGSGAGAAGGEAASDAAFVKMVADADPKKGESVGQVCTACHSVKKGGGTLIGPHLWDVVDRDKGSIAGFDYSKGLKDKGGKWTIADLDKWLTKPSAYIPGTKMGYPGEANEKKRAELIAWLRTLSDNPKPLPKVAEASGKTAAAKGDDAKGGGNGAGQAAGEAAFLTMVGHADPKKGQAAAQVCSACHNLKKGGGSLIGPDLWNVVDRKKGSVAGFDYSKGLKDKGGDWTFDDLNAWLTKPSAYIPGTKMGYPGEVERKEARRDHRVPAHAVRPSGGSCPGPTRVPRRPRPITPARRRTCRPAPSPATRSRRRPRTLPARPSPCRWCRSRAAPRARRKSPTSASLTCRRPLRRTTTLGLNTSKGATAPAKPEQKSEAPSAKPEHEAKAEQGAESGQGTVAAAAAGNGPEPYQAADPAAYPTTTAEASLPKNDTAAPALAPAGDKGEGDAAGPEPYAAPTPSDTK